MSGVLALLSDFATRLNVFPVGFVFGAIFGPARLAGVDFSKYYRDPGEVSERDDRSWIGLMKSTALLAGQTFTLLLLVAALSAPLLRWLALSISPPLANFFEPLRFAEWWSARSLAVFLAGFVVAQGLVEFLWRLGLRQKTRQPPRARLASSVLRRR